jgi:N-acetylmuramoyl-L-alanine amidase
MPAVRVEPVVGTDPQDADRMADPAFAGDVARWLMEGVLAFSRPSVAAGSS